MRHILLTLSACLAFAAGYAEKPVKGAHLRLENATYNFGDVPRKGGDLVREFRFVNDGTAPLVLVRVITSCSCLKASFSKRPVEPADSGVIRITYEPHKSEPGAFNKVIQVYSNSVDGRDVITVQGNSIEGQPRGKVKTEKVKVKDIRTGIVDFLNNFSFFFRLEISVSCTDNIKVGVFFQKLFLCLFRNTRLTSEKEQLVVCVVHFLQNLSCNVISCRTFAYRLFQNL